MTRNTNNEAAGCHHNWEDADSNSTRCTKCGAKFFNGYVYSAAACRQVEAETSALIQRLRAMGYGD